MGLSHALPVVTHSGVSDLFLGARIAQSVVCWAHCPALCSVVGLSLLGVDMGSDSIP